ncbi:hypothetical protein MNAN1_003248 [Malassezia nana]|uniref:Enoyl reductase (ER) domain-containing protein n=1 Tax=Malassezia nana TaxID=180528 RepID=A0AAF0EP87_9BASI|nr:hypothetical protein MNAN1_003248 [Malassezia nana]
MDNSLPTPPAQGNVSFVLKKVHETEFEDRPILPLGEGEVRVNVRQTGLCGSDCHYREHGRIGDFVLTKPMVLGHESAGIITEVGPGVTDRAVGDRVALEPGVPCLSCDVCLRGDYNHCAKLVFAATPPYDGTLATYYTLKSSFAHKIPDNMSLEAASLMEPLSVGVHAAVSRGQVRALQNVLVLGAGPIGLLIGAVARAFGARRVVLCDLVDEKLQFAESFCATSTFKPSAPQPGESQPDCAQRNARMLIEQTGGDVAQKDGFDLVLDATGAQSCILLAAWAARCRGRIVLVGMGRADVLMSVTRVIVREIEVTGSFRYGSGDYDMSIALTSTGQIDVTRLVTHRYLFADAVKAFDAVTCGHGEDGRTCIKVQICQGAAPSP